jgi:hypothetical protein
MVAAEKVSKHGASFGGHAMGGETDGDQGWRVVREAGIETGDYINNPVREARAQLKLPLASGKSSLPMQFKVPGDFVSQSMLQFQRNSTWFIAGNMRSPSAKH